MRFLLSRKFLIFFIPYFLLFLLTSRNALFWDTIQFAGDHPNWYYSNNFHYFFLPEYCDSGHPPAFGMYLAMVWKCLGRSLFVSHLAMLPFIVLLVAQAVRAGSVFFPEKKKYAALTTLLVLSESVLLTQCALVSPDILVAGFFLLAFNAILKKEKWLLTLAIIVMGVLSTRAMMCAVALYIFALSFHTQSGLSFKNKIVQALKMLLPFLPGAALAIAYFVAHYLVKGWVGYPKNSTWAGGFEIVAPSRMLKNLAVLGWRFIDLGKILTIIVFVFCSIYWLRKKVHFTDHNEKTTARSLFVLVLALFIITALPLVMYQGLLTHRYLLPVTISISLFTMYVLLKSSLRHKGCIVAAMVIVQLSGHFWTYPRGVSQGWEGTLGHLFFYGMQNDFRLFMLEHNIPKNEVAASPTMAKSDYRVLLTNDTTTFKDFETDSTTYVWYCNVTNAMNSKADYYFRNFDIVKQERKGNVEMVLFKRKNIFDKEK